MTSKATINPSAGRSLALPLDDDLSPPERRSISPAWARSSSSYRISRRNSQTSHAPQSYYAETMRKLDKLGRQTLRTYKGMSLLQKIIVFKLAIITVVLAILFLIYKEQIFAWLGPYAKKWRELRGGWLILWAMTCVVAIPPLIGYSTCVTLAGFVWGFPNGWFIAASATIVGSTISFLASRYVLRRWMEKWVAENKQFAAIALVLKHDGLKLLCMIRLCPLPYSLSNGGIATFPTVTVLNFAIATAIVSPKLLLHVFIGSRMALLAGGTKLSRKTKLVSWISIIISIAAGIITGYVMFQQTKKRAAELEEEESESVRRLSHEDVERGAYVDDPEERDAVKALRKGDDISLHGAEAGGGAAGYTDDWDEDADADAATRDDVADVFDLGDQDDEGHTKNVR